MSEVTTEATTEETADETAEAQAVAVVAPEWVPNEDVLREVEAQAYEVGVAAYNAEAELAECLYLARTQGFHRSVNGAPDLGGKSNLYKEWSSVLFKRIIPEMSVDEAVAELVGRVYAYSTATGRAVEVAGPFEVEEDADTLAVARKAWDERDEGFRKAVLSALTLSVKGKVLKPEHKVTEESVSVAFFSDLPEYMSNALVGARRQAVDEERERYRERVNKRVMRFVHARHTPEQINAAGLQVRNLQSKEAGRMIEASGPQAPGTTPAAGPEGAGPEEEETPPPVQRERPMTVVDAEEDAIVTAYQGLDPYAEVLVLKRQVAEVLSPKIRAGVTAGLPNSQRIAGEIAEVISDLVKLQAILTAQ